MNKKVNKLLSNELANLVNATEGNCARNVCNSFLHHRELLPKGSMYVEGAWQVQGQFDLHAWIENEEEIIDPTYAALSKASIGLIRKRTKILCIPWEIVEPHYKEQSLDGNHKLELVLDRDDKAVSLIEIYIDYPK